MWLCCISQYYQIIVCAIVYQNIYYMCAFMICKDNENNKLVQWFFYLNSPRFNLLSLYYFLDVLLQVLQVCICLKQTGVVEKERGVCNWIGKGYAQSERAMPHKFQYCLFQFLLVLLSLSNMWYYLDLWHISLSGDRQLKMKKLELQTEVPLSLWRRNISHLLINKAVSIKTIASNWKNCERRTCWCN